MELRSDRAIAQIDLDGGRLPSLVVAGHELLITEGTNPSRYGSFPMAPWAGRLPCGSLSFRDSTYEFPITSPPHANHSTAFQQQWTAVAPGVMQTPLDEPWPFGGFVRQTFLINNDALTVTMEVHAESAPMPALIGWHPWFRRQLDTGGPAKLDFIAPYVYETDDDLIPTGRLHPPPAEPWNHCFVGATSDPKITWPGVMTLRVSSTLDHWVVSTEPDHALCVEPQSGPPNQVNTEPTIVEPGNPLVGTMPLAWSLEESDILGSDGE